MEIPLFEASNGPCPYLKGKVWLSYLTHAEQINDQVYESLINQGFRRSGNVFYQNQCQGCDACVPIRLISSQFSPSKSQRKILRKNEDISYVLEPSNFDAEAFRVYQAFTKNRYQMDVTIDEFQQFLVRSAIDTQMMKYYDTTGKMVAVGWLDLLEDSISSVYFAFDPDESKRSLGTFSVMKELELCRQLNKPHLHLGFWVEGASSMLYKSKFYPHQFLVDGQWGETITLPRDKSNE